MSMDDKRRNYKAKQNECVLMARVSSRDQEVEGYSLPAQVRILKDYCLRKDLTILKIFEISESASGKKQRELFNEVLRYIADNKVKVLVCEKVDRLTRNFKDAVMIDDWLEEDEKHEVHLVKDSLIMHKYSRSQAIVPLHSIQRIRPLNTGLCLEYLGVFLRFMRSCTRSNSSTPMSGSCLPS